MLIDWFTVGAQMINFLILVWLLKRFLYKPVLLAIDTRESSIADRTAKSVSMQEEAKKVQDDFIHKSAEFDQTRKDLLVKAHDDANAQHQKLLEQARAEFETLREQQKDTLDRERLDISREIVKLTCKEVFTVARKTLTDLSSTSLEASMADVLITKIREMNSDDKIHLTDSLKQNSESVVVNSTFELPPAQRGAIKAAVKDAFAFDKEIEFETNPDLVCGIELSTQGYKVSWSISDYLKSLEQSVDAPPEAQNAA
jgi:F-type H+-transporting ATPase subunit b